MRPGDLGGVREPPVPGTWLKINLGRGRVETTSSRPVLEKWGGGTSQRARTHTPIYVPSVPLGSLCHGWVLLG